MKKFFILLLLVAVACACTKQPEQEYEFSSQAISQFIGEMTDVMVHDVTNPPLAGRFFSYACLAGYEVVAQHDSSYKSMHGLLKDYPVIHKPAVTGYSYQLSALLAMMETAEKMQPSGIMIKDYQQRFLDSCRNSGIPELVIQNSLDYAREISKEILAYAQADNYNRISNYPRYTPSGEEGGWYPTPPGFLAPVEPYFNTVRPFALDSATQFKPAAPVAFSKDPDSEFYRLLKEVYEEAGAGLSEERKKIASFWDCNPFAVQGNGHLLVGVKKISPGAHWLGITGIACQEAGFEFSKSMRINTLVAVGLMDGFIACWDEKFRSNRIRPETAIRKYIDPSWEPLLQTPPFPEYLSGHSTISAASAVVLTHFFGNNFPFKDTVEVRFGLPVREFESFHQAASEAAVSRLYGGIHFMDAIDNGLMQGRQVGELVIKKLEANAGGAGVVAEVAENK